MIEALGNSIITAANGCLTLMTAVVGVWTVFAVIGLCSVGLLVAAELEELDRMGTKPTARRH